MTEPNPYEAPSSESDADDAWFNHLKFWRSNPGPLAIASCLFLLLSLAISVTTFMPPRPILPDVVVGVLFLASVVCGFLAIRGCVLRNRKL